MGEGRWPDFVPRRIFLDTCTFQALADCGGYVFGEDPLPEICNFKPGMCPQVIRRPDGPAVLNALKLIFIFDERAHFDWIVSPGTVAEVDAGFERHRSSYVRDVMDHSSICLSDNPPSQRAVSMTNFLAGPKCGFLSQQDRRLLVEAAGADCDVFLTIEKRLPRIAEFVFKMVPLLITTPVRLWALLEPHLKGL